MKDRSELVRGWLRKAESDLTAMKACAQAGSSDAACFHAQQAAEKYLKAFLASSDRRIPPTHNLFKLIGLCAEIDPTFSELEPIGELLTPFAVELRYDTDFWPPAGTVAQAQDAAGRIREFVSSRLSDLMQTAALISPEWARVWTIARRSFDWKVDLRRFKPKAALPGFFDREITPDNLSEFEEAFRQSIGVPGQAARAAEVVFWKSYGEHRSRIRLTEDLLGWLKSECSWERFSAALRELQQSPDWQHFKRLRESCGQVSAFAVPLTFLGFSDTSRFPLADRNIADWWQENQPGLDQFARETRSGRIKPCESSWKAYLAWAEFCRKLAGRLTEATGERWRARDVEMAIWTARRKKLEIQL